ncbi:MAG TPA: RNA-binding protein [Xanthobacteraceae bacterium]|jgi:hypothetical protein|nr:RNA-binding protein [Xanthobacteraceae bacterium]
MLMPPDEVECDAGPRSLTPGMERLCVATRVVKPVDDMIRFVLAPSGELIPDLKRKLPGRGVWVTDSRACIAEAVKRKAFARSLKGTVQVPADLVGSVEQLLERSALDALAIAGKAGRAVNGFTKVEAAIEGEPVVAVLHAANASAEGVRKIAAALKRRFGEGSDEARIVDAFTSAQLNLALGRSHVIHAALLAGSASSGFLARCRKLERFRSEESKP